jgi:hypothetical protein
MLIDGLVSFFNLRLGLGRRYWRWRLLNRWRWRRSDIFGGLSSFGLLLGASSSWTRRRGGLKLLDKVSREYTLVLHALVVEIFPAIPVSVLLFVDGDDLSNSKVEVILMRRCVLVDGLDLEWRGHFAGD